MADKSRKFSKPRRYDDIENMHCILHPKEITPSEIATPSKIDTQERIVRKIPKKAIRKKKKITTRQGIPKI